MTQKATFSMNCFWGPQDFFSKLSGVTNTSVGYAGGEKESPTYEDLGDHTETLGIEFDPNEVSYADLLTYFFEKHDPTVKQSTQYKSIIFYHTDEQKTQAEQAKEHYEEKSGRVALTEIRPAKKFYPAEEYHQDYLAKARSK